MRVKWLGGMDWQNFNETYSTLEKKFCNNFSSVSAEIAIFFLHALRADSFTRAGALLGGTVAHSQFLIFADRRVNAGKCIAKGALSRSTVLGKTGYAKRRMAGAHA